VTDAPRRLLPLLAALATLAAAAPARAAVALVVDVTADELDATPGDGLCATAGGGCSLRAALQEVNAAADGGTVTFAFAEYTNLTFATALPTVTKSLTLDGPDLVTVVLGRQLGGPAADGRVLTLDPGAGAQVTLRDLRLGGGNVIGSGGAISATSGSLTLVNVTVVASTASLFGGGVSFAGGGALVLEGCYLEGNLATSSPPSSSTAVGGALRFDGTNGGSLLVRESAFVGNQAAAGGGGLSVSGGVAELRNVTMTQNSAYPRVDAWGGAVLADAATLSLRHVTLTGNGAAVAGGLALRSGATAALVNSVVAGNNGAGSLDEPDCLGALTGSVSSFVGVAGAACTGIADGAAGNRVGTLAAPLAARLRPVQSFGTVALLAMPPAIDSPLRDAGDGSHCAALPTDMVGTSRDPGTDGNADGSPACDLGAVEAPAGGPPTIISLTVDPTSLTPGIPVTASWVVADAVSCSVDWGQGARDVPAEGSATAFGLAADTTFVLTCTGLAAFQPVTGSVTVTVASANPVSITSFGASPTSIAPGGTSTLSWEVANATSCAIDDGDAYPPYPPDVTGASGSGTVQPDVTTTYTLTCQGTAGPVSAQATVTVGAAPDVAITSFTASPETIVTGGGEFTLSWTTQGATRCRVDAPWGFIHDIRADLTAGSWSYHQASASVTYTLACWGGSVLEASPVTAQTTVLLDPQAVVVGAFTASPEAVYPNEPVTLTWWSTNATSCTLSHQGSAPVTVATTGSAEGFPTVGGTTFTIACTNGVTSDSRDVRAAVYSGDRALNDNSGCGCSSSGPPRPAALLLCALVALGLLASRRRRPEGPERR